MGEKLFEERSYHLATEKFFQIIFQKKEEFSFEKVRKSYIYLLKISVHVDLPIRLEFVKENFANFLWKSKKSEKALYYFRSLPRDYFSQFSLETFQNFFSCLVLEHQLEEARDLFLKISYLFLKRSGSFRLSEIVKLSKEINLFDKNFLENWDLILSFLHGNLDHVKSLLKDVSEINQLPLKFHLFFEYFSFGHFSKVIDRWKSWRTCSEGRILCLQLILSYIKNLNEELDSKIRKQILTVVYDCFIMETEISEKILLGEVCLELKVGGVENFFSKFVLENILDEHKKESFLELITKIKDGNFKVYGLMDIGKIDFAEDLFYSEEKKLNVFAKIQRIIDEINFLDESNHKDIIFQKLEELEKIDPTNAFLKKYYEKESEKVFPKNDYFLENLEKEWEQDLLRISKQSDQKTDVFEKNMIAYLSRTLEEEFQGYENDLILAFYSMELYSVVIFLIEKIKEKDFGLIFILISVYMKKKEYYKAIDLIDDLLEKEVLIPEERISFLYLKAESLFLFGLKNDALDLYLYIRSQVPRYRLVEQRIHEIT